MQTDPARMTASELVDAYAAQALSPVETAQAVVDRIERLDPAVRGYCNVDADATLAHARAAEDRWRRNDPAGRLDGVPVAVKDVFLTAGWPTLRGSRTIDAAGPWEADAPAVAALRRHGALLTGKTTTPEFGWKGVTDSPRHGVTRNPWDPARTAGGSSGGSATAVALGTAPLAIGTDGGGSIRIPSSFCGLVGFKPTYGRVPIWPASPFGALAHAGPMTRTVGDAALLLDVISEPDPRDPTCLPPQPGTAARLEGSLHGLRIAYSPDLGFAEVEPEVGEIVADAAKVIADFGAIVDVGDPGFPDPTGDFETLWYAGAAAATEGKAPTLLDPGLAEIAEEGRRVGVLAYLRAARRRTELGIAMGAFHTDWDLLLTPTLPITAFAAGREVPEGWPHRRWHTWTPFTYPFNLTQQPAVSVPCGLTGAGLPVGLQIVGPRHSDALVLRAARAYEEAAPFIHTPPLADWP